VVSVALQHGPLSWPKGQTVPNGGNLTVTHTNSNWHGKMQAHSLIKAKASMDLADNSGRTALFYACAASRSKAAVVSMLLREPFNADEPHLNGASTPHAAAITVQGHGRRQLFVLIHILVSPGCYYYSVERASLTHA
jgi:ankyrin repeat protein